MPPVKGLMSEFRNDKGLIGSGITMATEREEMTRQLARAVLNGEYLRALQLAEELLPNESRRGSVADQHYTDQEFCAAFKINRWISASWQELGILGYLKLPNGQIRYSQKHIDALTKQCERLQNNDL